MPRVKLFDETDVLNKAMQLFWKQGYSATSVQDLVSHLSINRASLYDTFGDKEKLFKKAFEHYRKINIEGLNQFFDNQPDVKVGFKKLFDTAIDEAICDTENRGCFVVNTTTELVPGDEALLNILERNKQDIQAIFYNYLQRGKDGGEFKSEKDLKSLSSLFYTLYAGLRVISKVRPNKRELSNSVELALSLLN